MRALRERPTPGTIPSHFLALSPRSKHAIAVDASRSRLYLFENSAAGMRLAGDYYISVGKAGTAKTVEGDQRTPLGIYYITSNLDPKSLKDFYGSGALPRNTNILDSKRGKTGSGIWLHGTPPNQFSRPPLATDGCVVLANPDLQHIINTVEVRTTPVAIATELQWVGQNHVRSEGKPFEEALHAWRNAKTSGNVQQILSFYTPDFTSNGNAGAVDPHIARRVDRGERPYHPAKRRQLPSLDRCYRHHGGDVWLSGRRHPYRLDQTAVAIRN